MNKSDLLDYYIDLQEQLIINTTFLEQMRHEPEYYRVFIKDLESQLKAIEKEYFRVQKLLGK